MIDCLDSPVLAPMRSQILPLAEACIAHLEEDAAARIGDGVCQTIDLATLCPVSTVGGEVGRQPCKPVCVGVLYVHDIVYTVGS